jgi:ribosomal protein S2
MTVSRKAAEVVEDVVSSGKQVLLVGTKRTSSGTCSRTCGCNQYAILRKSLDGWLFDKP